MRRMLAAGAVTVAMAWAGQAGAMTAGKIAFVGNDSASSYNAIYLIDADGSNLAKLADVNVSIGNSELWTMSWSPDGTRIAFKKGSKISMLEVASGTVTDLTNWAGSFQNFNPAWSPDGTKIALSSWQNRQNDIYVMDGDGSNPVNLTNTGTLGDNEMYPSWSPDGSKILFSGAKRGVLSDVFVMNADGSNRLQLTTGPEEDALPRWSPDGGRIVYTSIPSLSGWVADVVVMGADGSSPVKLTNGTDQSLDASWSPDGARILFSSDRGATEGAGSSFNLFSMDPDGGNVLQLTHVGFYQFYWMGAWSPVMAPSAVAPASWGLVKNAFR